ncbi:MAG: hypothetical protein IH624_06115 [Phycisphaerae bacterium]|nr:hypothetical protein [Phycisphaerae bacterium]
MKMLKFSLTLLLLIAANLHAADEQVDLAKENADLKQRVGRLEQELAELKNIVLSQTRQAPPPAETTTPTPVATDTPAPRIGEPRLTDDQLEKIAAMVEKRDHKEPGPLAGFDFIPYGFIKLDASYDSAAVNTGNFATWVLPQPRGKDDEFNMTAKNTRLGLRINSREKGDILASGLVEVDFFGTDNGGENRPGILVRHAYAKLDWPDARFSILAGQYWDVISPLNPNTLNYTVQWYAGNIGYRRPQIRATKIYALSDAVDLMLEGAVTRNIGSAPGGLNPDTGADSGIPAFQGRVSSTFPLFGAKPTTVGFSGHWGKEEFDTLAGDKEFDSWSLNVDFSQPVNKWLAFQGELFTGENLSPYFGGINQGVNIVRNREIASRGGWVAARLTPWDKWAFNVGVSIEDVDNDDLVGIVGDKREYNRAVFGNVIYSINKSTDVGFELSHWRTDYQDQRDAESLRAQTSLIYKF